MSARLTASPIAREKLKDLDGSVTSYPTLSCQKWDLNPRLQKRLRPERSALDRSAILTQKPSLPPVTRKRLHFTCLTPLTPFTLIGSSGWCSLFYPSQQRQQHPEGNSHNTVNGKWNLCATWPFMSPYTSTRGSMESNIQQSTLFASTTNGCR